MEHSKEQLSLLGQAARAVAEINLQIAELEEQKKLFLEVFKNEDNGLVARTEPYDFGDCVVKVSANTRLDDGLAKRELEPHAYDLVSKRTLDTAKARKVLKPEELAKISKKYDNKIEVRVK